jgi:hypothetical protein
MTKRTEIREHINRPGLGEHACLFIAEDQVSYYNVVTVLNYLAKL